MLTGFPPFNYSSNRLELFDKIKYGSVKYPHYLSASVKSLLDGLFQKDPAKRFGFEEVKNHQWFSQMNWEAIQAKRIIPPFKPQLHNMEDLSNID
jgi:serum/glucocorticoid-regulated kinase 2